MKLYVRGISSSEPTLFVNSFVSVVDLRQALVQAKHTLGMPELYQSQDTFNQPLCVDKQLFPVIIVNEETPRHKAGKCDPPCLAVQISPQTPVDIWPSGEIQGSIKQCPSLTSYAKSVLLPWCMRCHPHFSDSHLQCDLLGAVTS